MLIKSLFQRIPQSRGGFMIYSRNYKKSEHKVTTMDDLPFPKGSWREEHARNNRYFNFMLCAGVIAFGSVITFGMTTQCINYRFRPPRNYE